MSRCREREWQDSGNLKAPATRLRRECLAASARWPWDSQLRAQLQAVGVRKRAADADCENDVSQGPHRPQLCAAHVVGHGGNEVTARKRGAHAKAHGHG